MKNHPEVRELRKKFDRVVVRHYREKDGDQFTHAAVVTGTDIFIGISRCDKRDQFCKRIGRSIALGRAIHEFHESVGATAKRDRSGRKNKLSYRVVVPSSAEVDQVLKKEIFKDSEKKTEETPVELL